MPTSLVSTGVQFPDSTTQTTALPAPGTNGNVLTSNGSAWTSSTPGGGSFVYLSTVNASSASTVDIESGFSSTYANYMIILDEFKFTAGPFTYANFNARLKIGGTYQTGSYAWCQNDAASSSGNPTQAGSTYGSTRIQLVNVTGVESSSSTMVLSGIIYIYGPTSTSSNRKNISWQIAYNGQNQSPWKWVTGAGSQSSSLGALTGIRLFGDEPTTVSITGSAHLYGIKTS